MIKQVSKTSALCKCCGAQATLFDVVDFSKNCEENRGFYLPLSGMPVYYFKCGRCGFIFTDQFDDFSFDDFKTQIYNEGYTAVDPDWEHIRPQEAARIIEHLFGKLKESLHILDYGSGSGLFADQLNKLGFKHASSYDPFYPQETEPQREAFHLVTCFEVVEHTPTPKATFEDMFSYLRPDEGLTLFSTLVAPPEIEKVKGSWWYIAPRNGHISIHTPKSLSKIIRKCKMTYRQENANLHYAYKSVPEFARFLIDR